MGKGKTAIRCDMDYREFASIVKQFVRQSDCGHISGLADETAPDDCPGGEGTVNKVAMNPFAATFLTEWASSREIVFLKKASHGNTRAIAFGKGRKGYLALCSDSGKNTAALYMDADFHLVYSQLAKEITGKDGELPAASCASEVELTVKPTTQIFLQIVENDTGEKHNKDIFINYGKKEYEAVFLDDAKAYKVEKGESNRLEDFVKRYIDENCEIILRAKDGAKNSKEDDPEYYTRLSFIKLTQSEQFPKSIGGFLKLSLISIVKSFTSVKNLIFRLALCFGMSILTCLWNLFALCYLNDTFNISIRALFGNLTGYLLAGVADSTSIKGCPPISETVNTVIFTTVLYYLLSIAIRVLIEDIYKKDIRKNIKHIFSFRGSLIHYKEAAESPVSSYIFAGIAVASVLSIVIFNPIAVALLAIMLLLSCMKCEDGGISPLLMIMTSSIRYKGVANGKKKVPLFAEFQLTLWGLGIGLTVLTVVNILLWYVVDFNFWIRVIVSIALIVLSLFRLGIISIGNKSKAAMGVFLFTFVQLALAVAIPMLVLADDGGWSESGGTIAGLMQNSGWDTIFGFSATLAASTIFGGLTGGLLPTIAGGLSSIFGGGSAEGAGGVEFNTDLGTYENSKDYKPDQYNKSVEKSKTISLNDDGKKVSLDKNKKTPDFYEKKSTLAEAKASKSAEATFYEGTAENTLGGGGSATVTVGKAEAHADASAGFYVVGDDGTSIFSPGVNAEVGTSATAFEGTWNQQWAGDEMLGVNTHTGVTAGQVGAQANVGVQVYNENGKLSPQFGAGVKAEATAAKAEGSANLNVLGGGVGVKGSVSVGAGAHADIGYKNGVIKADIGASIGVGASVGVEINIGGMVNTACGAAKSAWDGMVKRYEPN